VRTHARYYALHAAVAVHAQERGLDAPQALDVLRRCEVVLGGVASLHEHPGMAAAHGADKIDTALRQDAALDLGWLSAPGKDGYATSRNGFWGAYFSPELTTRMLAYEAVPTPGPALLPNAVEPLQSIFDLAGQDVVSRLSARPRRSCAPANRPAQCYLFCQWTIKGAGGGLAAKSAAKIMSSGCVQRRTIYTPKATQDGLAHSAFPPRTSLPGASQAAPSAHHSTLNPEPARRFRRVRSRCRGPVGPTALLQEGPAVAVTEGRESRG
jgi:hypothetical protein